MLILTTQCGGGSDNIKVEINYVMRCHLLPLEYKSLNLSVIEKPFFVLSVSKIELYAGKINALLSRNQIRDLYDTYQMINKNILNQQEIKALKNILLFYRYIQNDKFTYDPRFDQRFTRKSYVRDLLPVIKKGDSFNLNEAIQCVSSFISQLTEYDENQIAFIKSTESGSSSLNLLFLDSKMRVSAENHPLIDWKKMNNKQV